MNTELFEHVITCHYTVFDGLGGMHIEDIYEDRYGLLWVATADGGVSRFDSVNFDTFTRKDGLPSLTVMSIAEGADERLLFGTFGGGIATCDHDGRDFQVYTTEHGLPSNDIMDLQVQPDGSVLALTGAGVAWFAEGRCTRSLTHVGDQPLGRVYDMATDAAGTTWLATWEHGIISLDGRRMDTGDVEVLWPWQFVQDAVGQLWIAFHHTRADALIGCYDPQADQLAFVDIGYRAEGVAQQGVRQMRIDDKGWLWVVCRGVFCYDGQTWHHFSSSLTDINFSNTRLTYQDREGNVWIGLWGGGLIFSDPESVQCYTEADGLPDREVLGLAEDADGRMWVGTMGGMAWMEAGQIRSSDTGEVVAAMMVDRAGNIWSGGDAGQVYKWAGQTAQAVAVAEEAHAQKVMGLCEDKQGRVWVSTLPGRFGWIADGRFFAFDQWPQGECRALLQDQKGVFWIGFYAHIPALYQYADGQLRPVDGDAEEPIAFVNVVWEHQDAVWVGTTKGLFVFDQSSRQVRHFTVEQFGGAANGILALAVDAQGHVWLGTSGGGVLRYDGQTFYNIRLGTSAFTNIVEAILCDRQGQLWFGTRAGLIAYTPGPAPPGLIIREVTAGTRFVAPEVVSYAESIEEIRIHFQGIDFRTGARQMRYSHRLVGYGLAQVQWSAYSYANEVRYNNLPVGDYRFEVQAIDREGLTSEIAGLAIHVVADPATSRLRALSKASATSDIVHSHSQAMRSVMEQVERVADTEMTVLVLGETGTGKGLLARLIHETSTRHDQPFVQVNCGALPVGLVESELFGHEKGAFTSATTRQLGRFELADGGTIFLDEIGNLPLEAQRVLLHILEEKTLTRVGGQQPIPLDVRVVAATNSDLQQAIQADAFRQDLFYRLDVFTLELPPLRQRLVDIPDLTRHFATQFAQHLKRPVPVLSGAVIAHLQTHTWPGNVRELINVLQRLLILGSGSVIELEAVDAALGAIPEIERRNDEILEYELPFREAREQFERAYLEYRLRKEGGSVSKVATATGIERTHLYRKLRGLGIDPKASSNGSD